jgi:hypothetical protein
LYRASTLPPPHLDTTQETPRGAQDTPWDTCLDSSQDPPAYPQDTPPGYPPRYSLESTLRGSLGDPQGDPGPIPGSCWRKMWRSFRINHVEMEIYGYMAVCHLFRAWDTRVPEFTWFLGWKGGLEDRLISHLKLLVPQEEPRRPQESP